MAAWPTLLFWLLGAAATAWIGHEAFTTQMITNSPRADFWEHAAAMRALIEEGLFPGCPIAAAEGGSPRYMPHFVLVSLVGRSLSLDALQAMALTATLNMALLVVGCFFFFWQLFGDRRAPLVGLVVLLGSWYDPWHYSNVYHLHVLFSCASYPSHAALGTTLLGLAAGLKASRAGPSPWGWLAAVAVLVAYTLLTHPLTAMILLAGLGLIGLTGAGMRLRERLQLIAAVVGGVLLSLLWPHFSVLEIMLGTSGGESSWLDAVFSEEERGAHRLHRFYRFEDIIETLGLTAFGVYGVSALLHRREHAFLALGALAMTIPFVANAFVPIPLGHRFILLAIFFLQAGLVWMLLRIIPGSAVADPPGERKGLAAIARGVLGWTVALALLAAMSYQSIDLTFDRFDEARERHALDRPAPLVAFAKAAARAAGAKAVVIGGKKTVWPLATFGLRTVAPFHDNPLLADQDERRADARAFFRGKTPDRVRDRIVERYGVTHVLTRSRMPGSLRRWLKGRRAKTTRLPRGYRIHRVGAPQD